MKCDNIVRDKSISFGVRIIRFAKFLQDKRQYTLADQILRAGTSIGANIAESECAITKKDFLNKLYIALKEAAETLYWLELLYRSDIIDEIQYDSLNGDAVELKKLLVAITKTTSEKLRHKRSLNK